MKAKWIAGILLMTMTISACDNDTEGIGESLTSNVDRFQILTDTFNVSTRSIVADSVLARSQYTYLGRIKDVETSAYVTSDYSTQFMMLEGLSAALFAPADQVLSRDSEGKIVADSCHINIYINQAVGDTLAPMKLHVYELQKPISEGQYYYTDFDPIEEGYIRTDGISVNKTYTYRNYLDNDSVRSQSSYMPYINIPINGTYTDASGNAYNNYGTYIMRQYYEHPEKFKNAYSFIHDICPGFFFKTTGGVGMMSEVYTTELVVYYKYTLDDVVYTANRVFTATEEVLQTTRITNDVQRIKDLAADNTCTYLKTPAGLFTEVTLPVEDILRNHENDTISTAKIVFTRMNNTVDNDDEVLDAPTTLLMIPKDSLYSFFENKSLPDYKTSFTSTLSTSQNTYTFNNISAIVTAMHQAYLNGTAGENWNKVVLIPIEQTVNSSSSSITRVANLMSLTSTRLVGGSENPLEPIKISIIYNRFK